MVTDRIEVVAIVCFVVGLIGCVVVGLKDVLFRVDMNIPGVEIFGVDVALFVVLGIVIFSFNDVAVFGVNFSAEVSIYWDIGIYCNIANIEI